MSKRLFVRVVLVATALAGLSTTAGACDGDDKSGPKTGTRLILPDSAAAKQLYEIRRQDASLQLLTQLNYTPVTMLSTGHSRAVSYRLCGIMTVEECAEKGQPTSTHPVVYLFTTKVGLDDPIAFNGDFRLVYATPDKLTPKANVSRDAYKLYCLAHPSAAVASSPTPAVKPAMPVGYIPQFAEVGTYFSVLEYTPQAAMTQLRRANDGSGWDCTAHYEFM